MRSPVLTILLSLILLIVTWQLINFWQVTRWQQTLLNKIQLNKINTAKLKNYKKDQQTLKSLPNKLAEQITNKVESLTLAQIDLPALPYSPKYASLVQPQRSITQAQKPKINAIQTKTNEKIHQHLDNQSQRISFMYQQLTSNHSIDIEIAWPKNNIERQNTFSFLYQCLGMKFGVLNGQQTNQPKVTLAQQPYSNFIESTQNNNTKNQTSGWLRIAQGQLAHQEQKWLQQYELLGTPIRLFPKAVDWQLAVLLTQQLNDVPLTSLRARYKYNNHRLMLTNIKLNNSLLMDDWPLITSKCSI